MKVEVGSQEVWKKHWKHQKPGMQFHNPNKIEFMFAGGTKTSESETLELEEADDDNNVAPKKQLESKRKCKSYVYFHNFMPCCHF